MIRGVEVGLEVRNGDIGEESSFFFLFLFSLFILLIYIYRGISDNYLTI